MSEQHPHRPAWVEIGDADHSALWDRFEASFAFRPGMDRATWPAIREPTPSATFDLSAIADGPRRAAAYEAINAEALRAFVWALPEDTTLAVLDWQHPAYWFTPAVQATTRGAEWEVPVYPDGDYYAFLTPDLTEGTFGHPWEQTLCVLGARMLATLGRSLETWLPVVRRNGVPVPPPPSEGRGIEGSVSR